MKSPKQEAISDAAFGKRSYAAYLREQGKTYVEIGRVFDASGNYGRELAKAYPRRMRSLARDLRYLREVLEMIAETSTPPNGKEKPNGNA